MTQRTIHLNLNTATLDPDDDGRFGDLLLDFDDTDFERLYDSIDCAIERSAFGEEWKAAATQNAFKLIDLHVSAAIERAVMRAVESAGFLEQPKCAAK